jgi:hypothetical protein
MLVLVFGLAMIWFVSNQLNVRARMKVGYLGRFESGEIL